MIVDPTILDLAYWRAVHLTEGEAGGHAEGERRPLEKWGGRSAQSAEECKLRLPWLLSPLVPLLDVELPTFPTTGSPTGNCSLLIKPLLLMVMTPGPVIPGPGFET